jgi:hypothetical protein
VADVEILYDPITVNSGPVSVAVTGLNDIKVDSKLAVTQPIETKSALTLSVPDPVKTDATLAFTIPEPIRTEAKAAIDLQPVVVDQCLRLSLGPLPPTLVCLPNRQRIGLTLFGVEVFGFTLDGEARVVVGDLPHPPFVVSAPTSHGGPHCGPHLADPDPPEPHHAESSHGEGERPFVVRLGG